MPRFAAVLPFAITAFLASTPAVAQPAGPAVPGPYVFDIRASMTGLPKSGGFYPVLPVGTLVPRRGFGLDVGGHVYPGSLGRARLGIGVDVVRVRGTASTPAVATSTSMSTTPSGTPTSSSAQGSALSSASRIDVRSTITVVAPQISFSFGTREGWSYLSAGYGTALMRSVASGRTSGPVVAGATIERDSGRLAAVNYGGGARWFIRAHLAVGFDLRFHRLASAGDRPASTLVMASAGVSVR